MNHDHDSIGEEAEDEKSESNPKSDSESSPNPKPKRDASDNVNPDATVEEIAGFGLDATLDDSPPFDPDATVEENMPLPGGESAFNETGIDPNATVVEDGDFDPDATIEEEQAFDPDATIEEDRDFDPNATLVEDHSDDPNATVTEDDAFDPDATSDESNPFDPDATIEENREFDPDATLEDDRSLDPNATIVEHRSDDPHATVTEDAAFDPDATIDESNSFDPDATVEENGEFDPDATLEEQSYVDLDTTIDASPTIDQNGITVPSIDRPDKTVIDTDRQPPGKSNTETNQTLDETAETLAMISGNNPDDEIGDRDDESLSVLEDTDLGQTINPRALSDAEAKYWNEISSEFTSDREPTELPPAIDRTIVETRLQLRNQSVATQIHDEDKGTDYRLVRLLGRGGMGNVFVARQGSLDRLIAVKVIRPLDTAKRERLAQEGKLESVEQSRRQQFLSEAVVTGDLDHPNIVPIHDVAVTGDNTLFYSMKRVVGTPWSDVINEKTRDENLEILIKVADAIGFAHTRGVVHRDIKPENVMLGDFGVVMVMDWGIALAKPEFEKLDSITPATRLGGTPSMMAPEMAIGPVERIGPAADIYLLGATLFMVITGQPPHHAANVSQCLRAVANNDIRPYDAKHDGELMNIALKAMSADPKERYADTTQFQDAIREYRSHAESILLATRASEDLKLANETRSYPQFTRAQFGFEEAIALWDGNERAHAGLKKTPIDHAEAAYANQDYDLGLSLLDPNEPDHAELIGRLKEALRLREQREATFALLKKTAVAMLAFILIGGSIALYFIQEASTRAQRNASMAKYQFKIAQEQRDLAEENEAEAIQERQRAIRNAEIAAEERDRADTNAIVARTNADRAIQNARIAQIAKNKAEYEAYVSGVGLAKARIDRNEFTEARRLISGLIGDRTEHSVPWELRYLSSLANQSAASVNASGVPTRLAIAFDATDRGPGTALIRLDDGTVASLTLPSPNTAAENRPLSVKPIELPNLVNAQNNSGSQNNVSTITISRDGSVAAAGTQRGEILLWDPREKDSAQTQTAHTSSRLRGHRDRITDLRMVGDDYLVSSSADRTIRVWEIATGSELKTLWHIAPVTAMSTSVTPRGFRIAAAVAEKGLGQVVVWEAQTDREFRAESIGIFNEHTQPITSVAISPDANSMASGDVEGNVLVWSIADLKDNDITKLVKRAVQASSPSSSPSRRNAATDATSSRTIFTRLVNDESDLADRSSTSGISTSGSTTDTAKAHQQSVRNIQFSETGETLLTCGDDYLIHTWKPAPDTGSSPRFTWQLARTLRGHGGPVMDAAFLTEDGEQILSTGADQSIRLWISDDSFAGTLTSQTPRETGPTFARVEPTATQVHDDEIWSASMSPDGRRIVTASRDRTAKVLSINPTTLTLDKTTDLLTDEEDTSTNATRDERDGLAPIANLTEGTAFRAMSMHVDVASQRLFVGGADSVVRVWNLRRGTELETITGTGLNQIFAVSRDANVILTGSSSKGSNAILWRFDPGTSTAKMLHRLSGHEESVAAVALSPDATHALTADRAGRVIVWDVETGTPIGSPIDLLLGTRINDAAFATDGQSIWLAADDQRLSRINLSSREIVDRLEHDGFVTNVEFSEDGRRVITTSELQKINSTIHRATWWQLSPKGGSPAQRNTLVELTVSSRNRTRSGGRPGIASVAMNSSGREAIVSINPPGDAPSRVQRWRADDEIRNAKKTIVLGLPDRIGDVSSAAPVSDDELVTMHGNSAFRWNTNSRKLEMSYRINGALSVAAFSPDGDFVATGSRSLKLWDARNGNAIGKLESPHDGTVRCIAFIDHPAAIEFLTGGDDGTIRRWAFDRDTAEFNNTATIRDATGSSEDGIHQPLSISISPDSRSILTTTNRGRVVLHDLDDDTRRVLFDDLDVGAIHAGCFSPDGRFVAAAGRDRLARMWDLSKNHNINDPPDAVFQGHAEAIQDVALIGEIEPTDASRSTLRLFTASQDRSVRIWDPLYSAPPPDQTETKLPARIGPQGRELLELLRHTDGVMAVDFNADDSLMMTAGREGKVVLWPAP
nr:protein kinase [Rhodopirellula sp. SWK7]